MKKHFRYYTKVVPIVIGATVFTLSLNVVPVKAATTQDTTGANQTTPASTTLSGQDVSSQIQGFIDDVRSFVQGDLFGGITQSVQKAIGSVKVPDLGQVVSNIMKGSLPADYNFSTKVENNLANSYAIRQDAAKQGERVGALQVAQTQTLSKAAQEQSSTKLQQSSSSAATSAAKEQDSQSSDTSQRILRNISTQQKALADIANLQMQEASQARQDRALQLTLSAQAAEELNAANTRERQSAIAAGNTATAQGSLLTMPGGAVLGQPVSK
jgi:hypothetical protein